MAMSSSISTGAKASFCSRITEMRMYLAGDEDIAAVSVVNIKDARTFGGGNEPIRGGLYDLRLGPSDANFKCTTCLHTISNCPGHCGTYEIADKDYTLTQPLALGEVHKWLKVICLACGAPVFDMSNLSSIPPSSRLQTVSESRTGGEKCKCGRVHPKITKSPESPYIFLATTENEEVKLYPKTIREIFQRISNETVIALGRRPTAHPSKYYVSRILIPPISIRPYQKNAAGARAHKPPPLVDFIRNIITKSKISGTELERMTNGLYLNNVFYDMVKGGKQGGSKETANAIGGSTADSIMKRMGGKKGTLRNHQMGHRSLHGARLVISGNPNIKIDEIGVPVYVQSVLHISETVQNFNRDRLSSALMAGLIVRVHKLGAEKERNISEKNRSSTVLENGDVVYRMIEKGDLLNFNRQPSLKETATGSHKAVPFVLENINTLQINVSVCSNYGADFDGDQMNLKPLRTLRTIAEAKYISAVSRWYLSSQYSSAANGQAQDSVVGSALLTRDCVVMDKLHAMRCFTTCRLEKMPTFSKQKYTGREVLSLLLSMYPVSYKGKAKFYNEAYKDHIKYSDTEVNIIIKDGHILSGILDKKAIGSGPGTIFHLMAKSYGSHVAMHMVYAYQQICLAYLGFRGFTMSLDDVFIPKENAHMARQTAAARVQKANDYARQFIHGRVLPPLGKTPKQHYEEQQLAILSLGQDMHVPVLAAIDRESNGWFHMISYGSRGNDVNLLRTLACAGQAKLENERIPENFSPNRCSVYYPRYAMNPEARGFIKNCYIEGVAHREMAMGAIEAREQLIRKLMSTAITGTLLRAHVKNLESCIIDPMRRVMKSHMLTQYLYGDDGMDPRHLMKQSLVTVFMSDQAIKDRFPKAVPSEIEALIRDRDLYRELAIRMDLTGVLSLSGTVSLAVNVNAVVGKALRASREAGSKGGDTEKMRLMLSSFIDDLGYIHLNENQRKKRGHLPPYFASSVIPLAMVLRTELTTDTLELLSEASLQGVFDDVRYSLMSCMISPGLSCGVLAAQSLNEPLVQAMLNSIHGTSSGTKSVITKIKTVLGAKPSHDDAKSMTIRLKHPFCFDEDKARRVALSLIGLPIETLVKGWQVFLEAFGDPVHPLYAQERGDIESFHEQVGIIPEGITGWCIRLELSRQALIVKEVRVEDIIATLYARHNYLYVVHTTERSKTIYLRIYIQEHELSRVANVEKHVTSVLFPSIMRTYIRGIPHIIDAVVRKIPKHMVKEDGSMESKPEFIIVTNGADFVGLAGHDIQERSPIDYSSISSSDVLDTCRVFGLEAARMKIIDQLQDLSPPAYHHVAIYTHSICWSGKLVGIEKSSLREKNKTLLRATAHGAGKVLGQAALQGIREDVSKNISGQMMLGTTPKVGTHSFDILVNEAFVMENTKGTLDLIDEALGISSHRPLIEAPREIS